MLVGDLTLLKCLGKGAFGEVYLTSKQGSSQKFATKKIDKKFAKNPRAKKYLDNEINILKEIDHPNIIKLYEVHQTTQYYYYHFVPFFLPFLDTYIFLYSNRHYFEYLILFLM